MRPSGTTEDGVERIKLLILAIGEKKDRITAEDLGKTWLNKARIIPRPLRCDVGNQYILLYLCQGFH